jgi:hypothetical protein
MNYQKLLAAGAGAVALSVGASAFALSSNDYALFDGASYVSPGNGSERAVQLVSNASTTDSGVDFGLGSTTTLADLTNLSTDYQFTAGSCGGGSPRFQINVQTASGTKNIFAYIGAAPNYTNCAQGVWASTGNLITGSSTVDATQLGGGFYEPWSQVLTDYGSNQVTGVQLVADGSWAFATTGQTVNVDNTLLNTTLFGYEATSTGTTTPPTSTSTPPTAKAQCKDSGWMTLDDGLGHGFKNQGDCVSFVATGGRNEGAGAPTSTTVSAERAHGNGRGSGRGN